MIIGVVSDTHSLEIPQQLLNDFKTVDLIIHTGDFCNEDDLKKFSAITEVKAVYGNMDAPSLTKKLPQKLIFQIESVTIGLFHGEGPPRRVIDFVQREFENDKVDIVLFGHSHHPMNEKIDDIIFFNPGSPNDTISAPFCSYGMLEINGANIDARIIKVKNG